MSNDIEPAIDPRPDTDLAALNLGESAGYRIYYRDQNGSVSILQYTGRSDTSEGHWGYGYHVTQEQHLGASMQAGFVNADRITVVTSLVDIASASLNFSIQVCTSRDNDWLLSKCWEQPRALVWEGGE